MIDNQELARAPGGFEFQPNLLLDGREDGWGGSVLRGLADWVDDSGRVLVDRKLRMELVFPGKPGLVDKRAIQDEAEQFAEIIDGRVVLVHHGIRSLPAADSLPDPRCDEVVLG